MHRGCRFTPSPIHRAGHTRHTGLLGCSGLARRVLSHNCSSSLTWSTLTLSLQVYHPNIDLEGHICLNILREDWKPVLSISSVVYGLQFLFLVSRREDPRVRGARQEGKGDRAYRGRLQHQRFVTDNGDVRQHVGAAAGQGEQEQAGRRVGGRAGRRAVESGTGKPGYRR